MCGLIEHIERETRAREAEKLPWWDNIAGFIRYEDRYDFVGPDGEVIKSVTPEEFAEWKKAGKG